MGATTISWQTTDPDLANRWALLLEALGVPHEIVLREDLDPRVWELRVQPEHEALVRENLQEEAAEHRGVSRREKALRTERDTLAREWHHFQFDWKAAVAFALILAAAFTASGPTVEVGRVEGESVRAGEWWRLFTALTLHADLEHLISNLVAGTLIFGTTCGFFGSGVGFFAVVMCGAVGNLLSVCGHPPEYSSLGSSTAIFGALGLLAGALVAGRRRLRVGTALAPAVVGFMLFLLFGVGGARSVDVTAHFMGFLVGLLVGGVLGLWGKPLPPWVQLVAGLGAVAVLEGAWQVAL